MGAIKTAINEEDMAVLNLTINFAVTGDNGTPNPLSPKEHNKVHPNKTRKRAINIVFSVTL